MTTTDGFEYVVRSASTATFGRVLLSARDQHIVVDGPAQNGCPGEALTPAELFLGGVATCAAELVGVIARQEGIALAGVEAEVAGAIDRAHARRPDVTLFSRAALRFTFHGPSPDEAANLVKAFKGR
jgi:uncharacterized OsmC-like protein